MKQSVLKISVLALIILLNEQVMAENASTWYQHGQEALLAAKQLAPNTHKAKNVILFVGDGMGVSTVTAARILQGQLEGRDGEGNQLAFEKLPYLALSKTYSANQQTADSAATITAIITGVKTNGGVISVDQRVSYEEKSASKIHSARLKTILEHAEQDGRATGVISTARITHATPAATYAHTSGRDWESDNNIPAGSDVKDIASQLIDNFGPDGIGDGIEVVLGGGRSRFLPNTVNDLENAGQKGERRDGRHLVREYVDKFDATFVWNKAQFDAIDPTKTNRLLGLFERSHMQYEHDRPNDTGKEPSLADMAAKAIDILQKNPKGYFLLVEAGRIDHGHHANNAYRALTETIALSDAVKKTLEKINLNDTLVIVTADHSHTMTIGGYPQRGNPILGKVTVDGKLSKAADGNPYTTLSYANGKGYSTSVENTAGSSSRGGRVEDMSNVDTTNPDFHQEVTVPLGGETHGAEEVEIFAGGPNAHLFHGIQEQNYIFHVMKDAFGY
ncbi:alkaline phosphatase [Methylobacillus gramineus]|uniref:alkaline phosphatase n=1 Tax=Methylobacillus gramineus TaxID=755169 RepID=UPI001CFFA85A|nr:alkaline phosphatase [Methylobacillus gramineus]MCB5186095.1 alkaline phosphatase [Methylobacillus gramineus]